MEIYPVKAQYLKNEEVLIHLEFDGTSAEQVFITVYRLEQVAGEFNFQDLTDSADLPIGSFSDDFAGYGVVARVISGGASTSLSTAFDVVDNPKRSLRYGFLSDFTAADKDNGAVETLRKYHINMVQFYDWSYRHDFLVSEESEYTDMMGKRINTEAVRTKIRRGKELGMHSIAYGAIYAASKPFYDAHPDWGLYNSNQDPFVFIDVFYIMNIAAGSPWRPHLFKQYQDAVQRMGFSGIHMDTYGFPKTAYSHLADKPELIHLDKEFPTLINESRDALKEVGNDPYLIFNNVGNWPVYATADCAQDAVYVEVWNPYDRYEHIAQIIQEARFYGGPRKPVILAAYLKPFQESSLYEGAAEAAYILTAAIVSQGAYHLLMGERNAVLTQGYYSDYTSLQPQEAARMRSYYDFMIRYMELFYDQTLKNVSMTHMGWDNYEYACSSHPVSVCGEPGKIWAVLRESDTVKCISLINLSGCDDDYWNREKSSPTTQKDIQFSVQVDHDVSGVYTASPDRDCGTAHPLQFMQYSTDKGKFVKFSLPELSVWSVIWIKF